MIHHVSFEVSSLETGGRFYDALLGPLGWRRLSERGRSIGYGLVRPIFWISDGRAPAPGGASVCFRANSIPAVRASYESGLEDGGSDDGAPSQRPEYGPTYFSAYLLDPDGNRVEVAVGSG
ncbi:VOC family protein [Thermoleophilia bacterium SCSIO 60948]|nr:VOC family protein [Thermoleophilia bacterium SCSIO 60948]